jgi:predicted ArsR family transcriptional regulator
VSHNIEHLSEVRQSILLSLKHGGPATIAKLAGRLKMTGEAIRQHLLQLEGEGWIEKHMIRTRSHGGGRPSMHYRVTSEGEHLFPKSYDSLTVEVLDTVAEQLGADAITQLLKTMTEARVMEWEPRLRGLSILDRLEALKQVYSIDDTFMEVEQSSGRLRLVEHNCPFLNVAKRRPVLCSVTVSVLTRLLGFRVVREERFQDGDGHCAFRVMLEEPIDEQSFDFAFET